MILKYHLKPVKICEILQCLKINVFLADFFYACKTQVINQMGTKSACKGLAKNCTIYITFPRILANSRVMCQRNLATKYSTLFQPLQQLLAK